MADKITKIISASDVWNRIQYECDREYRRKKRNEVDAYIDSLNLSKPREKTTIEKYKEWKEKNVVEEPWNLSVRN